MPHRRPAPTCPVSRGSPFVYDGGPLSNTFVAALRLTRMPRLAERTSFADLGVQLETRRRNDQQGPKAGSSSRKSRI